MAVYQAQWNFQATEQDQLSMQKGDLITLLRKDESGWWLGEKKLPNGQVVDGLFPANYCKPVNGSVSGSSGESVSDKMDKMYTGPSSNSLYNNQNQSGSDHMLLEKNGHKTSDVERRHIKELKEKNQKPISRTVFRVYAHKQIKYGAAVALVSFGLLGVHFGLAARVEGSGFMDVILGIVAAGVGILFSTWESMHHGAPLTDMFPLRALMWTVMAGVCFVSFPLWTAGLFLLVASMIDVIGFLKEEPYNPPKQRRKTQKEREVAEYAAPENFCDWVKSFFISKYEENKLQRMIFCAVYIGANIGFAIYTFFLWLGIVNAMPEEDRLTIWVVFARLFGAFINLNSPLLLIPVCRTIIRILYNIATSEETRGAKALRVFFAFVPLDKAILLHRTAAKVSLMGVIGHTIFHFINYQARPDQTVRAVGLWPFYSGIVLLMICQMLYHGAFEDVKRPNFEIFWYSHHLFIPYFLLIITHGAMGLNLFFTLLLTVPAFLYITERILREVRAKREVAVTSVTTMEPNLLAIEFDKESAFGPAGYREGHMRPEGKTFHEFHRRNAEGQLVKGRIYGPNEKQILLIDGPHSAPTQHMTEYEVAIIAGAGIGLTPVVACTESIVYHRWKYGLGKVYPAHTHFFWVVSYRDIEAYRWFISKVTECQRAVSNMRSKGDTMKGKTWNFHIFITSVPKTINQTHVQEAMIGIKRNDFWGRQSVHDMKTLQEKSSFEKKELFAYMLNPTETEKKFNDVRVVKGRPKWDPIFQSIAKMHPKKNVGVMFCGNPFIGKDLKKMCIRYSSVERGQLFRLHKENF
eukprot:jgi/Bigna1/80967/fgenesh1_pg.76_\